MQLKNGFHNLIYPFQNQIFNPAIRITNTSTIANAKTDNILRVSRLNFKEEEVPEETLKKMPCINFAIS